MEPLLSRLLALITAEPGSRVPFLRKRLGVSRATIERALQALKAEGLVTFRGAPKTGGYFLVSRADDEASS